MRTSDAQIAALRALLVHDAAASALTAALGEQGTVGYQYLADAALAITARRRFAPSYTSADLIRFVASVRIERLSDGDEYDLDPVIAENVLRRSLGQKVPVSSDPGDRLRVVVAILGALTDDASETEIDDVLAEARVLMDRRLVP
jgi:hypothetical protein